jgi:hypothetical protein
MALVHKKSFLLVIGLILLLASSFISTSQASAELYDIVDDSLQESAHYYRFKDNIMIIFYDRIDKITNTTANSLYDSLALLTPNVIALPVESINDIERVLEAKYYDVAIWVFNTDHEALKMQSYARKPTYSWQYIANFLQSYEEINHIFATGNTKQLYDNLPFSLNEFVYGANDELTDAQHLFIYTLWTLADILQTKFDGKHASLGNDVRMATLEYFSNNFNTIASSSVEPSAPMGTESPTTIQARIDKYYNEHPIVGTKLATDGYIIDEELNREVDQFTGEVREDYGVQVFPSTSLQSFDFILQLIPEDTGLRGPIGGILDTLLPALISLAGDAIGIDADTLTNIVNVLVGIPDFIGAISDPSASKIKEFLDKLKPLVPIPQDMLQYFDLLIDGLFLLRGSAEDIQGFISTAIDLLLPEGITIGSVSLKDVLTQVFSLGISVFDKIDSGANAIDIILSVMNENIVQDLIKTFLGDGSLFGLSPSQLTSTISSITAVAGTIINLLATGNIKDLIFTYGPQLLTALGISMTTQQQQAIMTAMGILLTATDTLKGLTLEELFIQLLSLLENNSLPSLNGVSGFGLSSYELLVASPAEIVSAAKQIVNIIGSNIQGSPSLPSILSSIDEIISTLPSISGSTAGQAIKSLIAIIIAISSSELTLDNSISIGTMVVDFLTHFGIVSTETKDLILSIMNTIVGVVNFVSDKPNLSKVFGDFLDSIPNVSVLIEELIKLIVNFLSSGTPFSLSMPIMTMGMSDSSIQNIETLSTINDGAEAIGEAIGLVVQLITTKGENALENLMMTLLNGATFVISEFLDIDITAYVELFKGIFGQVIGLVKSPPSLTEILDSVLGFFDPGIQSEIQQVIQFIVSLREVFTGGFRSIFGKLTEFVAGLIRDLIDNLTGDLLSALGTGKILDLNFDIPIGVGSFSLFTIKIGLGLSLGLELDVELITQMIFDLVFKGVSIFDSSMTAAEIFRTALSFISITPIFEASFELADFDSGSSQFLSFMLSAFGLDLSISGYGFFKIALFSFKNGIFNMDDFFKIIEWGFGFSITISRTFTLLDFLTGGAAGSLNAIGKYIGLDAISITIAFTIAFEIIKRAAMADKPETGTMTLSIGIAFTVSLGIDILIAKLVLTGTLKIVLTLLQDLVAPTPMRVYISIQLIITVTIGFLFWDWDFEFKWSPSGFAPPLGYELTAGSPEEAVESGALGGDSDGDGLSDAYELSVPGLDPYNWDTDGDGLSDKFEIQTLGTDPTKKDTDGDGLDDYTEYMLKTDPLNPDSDYDGLTDYEEVVIYGTNPLSMDTDEDGLDDYYEIHTPLNMTGITPSVLEVIIGGIPYSDRTDPLNPDTDGDGLLDGDEGPRGIYYGPELFDTSVNDGVEGAEETLPPELLGEPIIFNGGYTHPLDNDTDDDSYAQVWNHDATELITMWGVFLRDMSDGTEVKGISVIFIDPETGEPEPARIVRTNPTSPDSDMDTGPPEPFKQLNSDGYELHLDPPTDPLDGDTDDDGLLDGLEGFLGQNSFHTDPNNPDTDGDGLGDLQEILLGTNPRSVDTDGDGVTDGDEYFIYGTNPLLADTDGDGLTDGEELFIFHTSPFMWDSDGDGLSDYDEVWIYFTNPADEDSDNDGLTDWEEIFVYYTNPMMEDTDGDGILDGDEVRGLPYYDENGTMYLIYTDPTKWDTDGDSLLTLDQDGEISQPMSDLDEYLLGTDPTRSDTDGDGLYDGWEVWLGRGKIPGMEPIHLNPLSADSDGDGLLDGEELIIANMTTLLNPYIGFYLIFPYNTSPVMWDTDGDFLSDYDELMLYGTDPASRDTDGDTLTDYDEIVIYGTNPAKNDTDGDGLMDNEELFGFYLPWDNTTKVFTNGELDPNNPDSDGDLLPDGAEVFFYMTDPTNPDENNNGILDGFEIDSDGDGLFDGEEYFIFRTVESGTTANAILDPDSDKDGLFDGFEARVLFTRPDSWDTDEDSYSDGLEYFCGTDPLDNSTQKSEFDGCFPGLSGVAIISPQYGNNYKTNNIPVVAYEASGNATSMVYRWREFDVDDDWSSSVVMTEKESQPQYWSGPNLNLPEANKTYELEILANVGDKTFSAYTKFSVNLIPGDQLLILSITDDSLYQFAPDANISLPIEVQGGLEVNAVTFDIAFQNGTKLYENESLIYSISRGTFYKANNTFPAVMGLTNYTLTVYGQLTSGGFVTKTSNFAINVADPASTDWIPGVPNGVVIGAAAALVAIPTSAIVGPKAFKKVFKKSV